MITKELVDRIAKNEGLSLKAYKDSLAFWTIGYGHLLPDQEKDWSDYSITNAQALAWLAEDIQKAYVQATETPEWQWLDTPGRQGVWIEMIFNLGWDKLKKFTLTRTSIRNQRWDLAAQRMLASLWAKEVKGRAITLAKIMEAGE